MEYFLKELSIIRKKYQAIADREEKFNIFSALHKTHDERRLHSRFISVLLQPNGRHGHKTNFLVEFISQIEDLNKFVINENTQVFPRENDKKENNNIDILILNRKEKQCIIIENKIYAGDSNLSSGGQLERYINHAIINEEIPNKSIYVIYLTIDGHEPSIESIGKYKDFENLYIYSYEYLILPWLNECLKYVVSEPFLRESIIQYQKLINNMTGNSSSIEERIAYKELIGSSKDNMDSAKKIIENFKHVKWHSVFDFWNNLQNLIIADDNYELVKPFDRDNITSQKKNNCISELTHYETYRKGQKNKQKCNIIFKTKEEIFISLTFSANYDHFYFGIPVKENADFEFSKTIASLTSAYEEYKQTKWMLLLKIFDDDIKFNDFNKNLTFSLINSENNKKLAEKAFKEIQELTSRITKTADNTL
ncbi:PDDEXK-like family protein [Geofilum rhodophaeum]|uniref:PDDEXK-like family protein n=1 Tax=Geofilum rhodophaeum TaxID=1965019 RepID=UPI000B520793|nr:PD-(D/E)XK nuclease family protein [Geofilum rhodophaeum]